MPAGRTGAPQGRHQGCRSSRRFHHARCAPYHADRLFREPPGLRRTATDFAARLSGQRGKTCLLMPAMVTNKPSVQIFLYRGLSVAGRFCTDRKVSRGTCALYKPLRYDWPIALVHRCLALFNSRADPCQNWTFQISAAHSVILLCLSSRASGVHWGEVVTRSRVI